jgi:hypothetical protein
VLSIACVHAARRARLVNDNFTERRQQRLESTPNPYRKLFAGRIFEPRHVVQTMVIDLRENRRECRFYVSEVHDPAGLLFRRSRDVNLYAERMPMQTSALMARWHVRQPMRRFDLEDFENVHI